MSMSSSRAAPRTPSLVLCTLLAALAAAGCKGRDEAEKEPAATPATAPAAATADDATARPPAANPTAETTPAGAGAATAADTTAEPDASDPSAEVPKADAEATPPAEAGPLLETLRSRAQGGDVALFLTPGGVVAVDAAGNVLETLTPGGYARCATDPATDALWLVREVAAPEDESMVSELHVFDLRAPALTPVPVLSNAPAPVSVVHAAGTVFSDSRTTAWVTLDLRETPSKLDVTLGDFDGEDEAASAAARERVVVSGETWLTELATRARAAPPAALPADARIEHEAIDPANCEETELCGSAELLTGSDLALVIVGHSCGDWCYVERHLFDRASNEFLDANNPQHRAATYEGIEAASTLYWSPEARAFVHGSRLFGVDGKERWSAEDATPCGWLSAQSAAVGRD